jgi:hypothetical protein
MKISFPKYGPGELLINERGARCIISSVIIGFFAGLCGSYLLQNKFWLLTIALTGIGGILLCLGGAAGIFLNYSKVDEAPSANIRQDVPRITLQWDYRAKKPIRPYSAADSPSAEISEVLSPAAFGIDDNVWCNDNLLEGATSTFISGRHDAEERLTDVLSEATDPVCAAHTADDAAVSGYDQSPIDEPMVVAE